MIFDVGANVGQTVTDFRSYFPKSVIHSFEPSPTTFQALTRNANGLRDVHLWNFAFGSTPGRMTLRENSFPEMSSFLQLGDVGWGKVVKETPVEIKTVDQFCQEQSIQRIDILKSDTQGFDLEVLAGAEELIRAGRIGLVYLEVNFAALYENLPSISRIYDFMIDRDFYLVSFYWFHYRKRRAAWTDALFVHKSLCPDAPDERGIRANGSPRGIIGAE